MQQIVDAYHPDDFELYVKADQYDDEHSSSSDSSSNNSSSEEEGEEDSKDGDGSENNDQLELTLGHHRSVNSETDALVQAQTPSGLINDDVNDNHSIKSEGVARSRKSKKSKKNALSEISSSLSKMKNHLVNPVISAKKLKNQISKVALIGAIIYVF
jgi:hypothetical protein